MIKSVLLAACAALTVASAPASAATVSVYDAVSTTNEYKSFFQGRGDTVRDLTTGFTAASLVGSDFVVLSQLAAASGDQLTALRAYVLAGGRLYVASDGQSFNAGVNATFNSIAAAVGSAVSNTGGDFFDGGGFRTTTQIAASPFTAGVTSITYAYTSGLSGGTTLVRGNSSQVLVSYDRVGAGFFFGSADVNIKSDLEEPSVGNGRLLSNLLTVTPAATAPVPEPATWGLMLAGFGIVGAGLRSRRRSTTLRFV